MGGNDGDGDASKGLTRGDPATSRRKMTYSHGAKFSWCTGSENTTRHLAPLPLRPGENA